MSEFNLFPVERKLGNLLQMNHQRAIEDSFADNYLSKYVEKIGT